MKDAGFAHMGVGVAKGAGKAENAAKAAISSPLLETSIAGARGVIINITSSPDIGLDDVETAASMITQSAHPDANIIWGTAFDERLADEMNITVVATGFENTPGGWTNPSRLPCTPRWLPRALPPDCRSAGACRAAARRTHPAAHRGPRDPQPGDLQHRGRARQQHQGCRAGR